MNKLILNNYSDKPPAIAMTIQDANNKENSYNTLISTGGKIYQVFQSKASMKHNKNPCKKQRSCCDVFPIYELRFSAIKVIDHLRSPSF